MRHSASMSLHVETDITSAKMKPTCILQCRLKNVRHFVHVWMSKDSHVCSFAICTKTCVGSLRIIFVLMIHRAHLYFTCHLKSLINSTVITTLQNCMWLDDYFVFINKKVTSPKASLCSKRAFNAHLYWHVLSNNSSKLHMFLKHSMIAKLLYVNAVLLNNFLITRFILTRWDLAPVSISDKTSYLVKSQSCEICI